jgi:predicted RNase H-like HicB family nuclease
LRVIATAFLGLTPEEAAFVEMHVKVRLVSLTFTIDFEREDDGRWIGEIPDLPGVLCYGRTRDEAVARVQALALRVIAERLEHDEAPPELLTVSFRAA